MIAGTPRIVADGLRFPEGPVALGDGAVACVEMQGGAISRVAADGTVSVIADLGGAPNGATLGSDGALDVANNGGLSINADGTYWHAPTSFDGIVQRVDAQGVATAGTEMPGDAPHRPNDLCVAADGSIVVSDSSNWEDMRNLTPGRIVRIAPSGETTLLGELAAMPNGVAFSPDGTELFVAQSLTRRIWAYQWTDAVRDGAPLTVVREFCRLDTGSPDGMCFDTTGRLFVCGSIGDAISVFDPSGQLLETIDTGAGSQATNCCLADGQLYVTLGKLGQLVAFDVDAQPLDLHAGKWVAS